MNYNINVAITKEEVQNMIEQAIYGANQIGWINQIKVVNKSQTDIFDCEDEVWREVTLDVMLKGLSLYRRADYEEFDMFNADCVMQLGLFGEQKYA